MAYKFTCPHCGRSEYSAAGHRDKEKIKCVYCGKEYLNPYYKRKEDDDNG